MRNKGLSKKVKLMKVCNDEQDDKAMYVLVVQAKAIRGRTYLRPDIVWKSCPAAQEDVWWRVKFLWKYRMVMEVL